MNKALKPAIGFCLLVLAATGQGIPLPPEVLALPFDDEQGKTVTIRTLTKEQPAIFYFGYTQCKRLCPVSLSYFVEQLAPGLPQFKLVMLSIKQIPDAASAKALRKQVFSNKNNKLHDIAILYDNHANLSHLARALGVPLALQDKELSHPAVFTVINQQGEVVAKLQGLAFNRNDLRQALRQAGPVAQVSISGFLLQCFKQGIPGPYGKEIALALRASSGFFLILFIWSLVRCERRRRGGGGV